VSVFVIEIGLVRLAAARFGVIIASAVGWAMSVV
jgi:hypothetical protein